MLVALHFRLVMRELKLIKQVCPAAFALHFLFLNSHRLTCPEPGDITIHQNLIFYYIFKEIDHKKKIIPLTFLMFWATFFLLWNIKEDILKQNKWFKPHWLSLYGQKERKRGIFQNNNFCVSQKTETHKGLEWHKGEESKWWEILVLEELSLSVITYFTLFLHLTHMS